MAEASLTPQPATGRVAGGSRGTVAVAWRNLWRNRRRTWLMAGSIGFAAWMLIFSLSLQDGTFTLMLDNSARVTVGHVQVQHPDFQDNPRLEHVLTDAQSLRSHIEALPGVAAAALRGQAMALVSSDERSFAAQVLGVEAGRERQWSTVPASIGEGRYLESAGEACIGSVLARNLGVAVGDEIVLLGTAKEGGVAAAVSRVVGLIATGTVALDRSIVQVPLADFQAAWDLAPDEAHALVVVADDVRDSLPVAREVAGLVSGWQTLNWKQLMPEVEEFIQLKIMGTWLFFVIIAVIVTFSIVNAFMMTLFERTPEFGMLKAIGMRPVNILFGLQIEAVWLWALGMCIAIGVSLAMILPMAAVGIPLPVEAAELTAVINMPDRMFPLFSREAAWAAGAVMFAGTQLALLVPARRLWTLRCVDALRARE